MLNQKQEKKVFDKISGNNVLKEVESLVSDMMALLINRKHRLEDANLELELDDNSSFIQDLTSVGQDIVNQLEAAIEDEEESKK